MQERSCHDGRRWQPLLLLSRAGEGRVALLLSDHICCGRAAMKAAGRISTFAADVALADEAA